MPRGSKMGGRLGGGACSQVRDKVSVIKHHLDCVYLC